MLYLPTDVVGRVAQLSQMFDYNGHFGGTKLELVFHLRSGWLDDVPAGHVARLT